MKPTGRRIIDQQRAQWRDTPEAQAHRAAAQHRSLRVRAAVAARFPEGPTSENFIAYLEFQDDLLRRADATSPLFDVTDPLWK